MKSLNLSGTRLLLPLLLGAAAIVVAVSPACGSTTAPVNSADFFGPAGLAVAPARDRDLLFVASSGSDDLRAITICNAAPLPDGGPSPTTCQPSEDFQFLPGPIRVFPGSFAVGNRPLRMAPISLLTTDGQVSGGVLVAGVSAIAADGGSATPQPLLKLVDSVNVLDTVKGTDTLKAAVDVLLDAPPLDVVSVQIAPGDLTLDPLSGSTSFFGDLQLPDGGFFPQPGAAATAFVLTQATNPLPASGGSPATPGLPYEVVQLSVAPGASGPAATVVGHCSLDIVPSRLALPPGRRDVLYVGDVSPDLIAGGRGDGVLELDATAIPPLGGALAACPVKRRIIATNAATGLAQNIIALAASPAFFSFDTRTFASGAFLLGVTGDGGVIVLRTDTAKVAPLPPFRPLRGGGSVVDVTNSGANGGTAIELPDGSVAPLLSIPVSDGDGGIYFVDGGPDLTSIYPGVSVPAMEPLRQGFSRAVEVGFLNTPTKCPALTPFGVPCVLVNVGSVSGYQTIQFALVGTVTTTDGAVNFIDVDKRRFISDLRDGNPDGGVPPNASVTASTVLQPNQAIGVVAPTLSFPPADAIHPLQGWTAGGVTQTSTWRIVWHGQMPGLERRGGSLSRAAGGQLRLDLPTVDLTKWAGLLDVGDVVSFLSYGFADGSPLCDDLALENSKPLTRENRIAAIGPDYLILDPSLSGTSADGGPGFDPPDSCLTSGSGLSVGAVVEVRPADGLVDQPPGTGRKPWLVFENADVRGRTGAGVVAAFKGQRFDYPLFYSFDPNNLSLLPRPDSNISLAFEIDGSDVGLAPYSAYTLTVTSGQAPTRVVDQNTFGGFGGPVITYSSLKLPGNLVFASITGSNDVTQIDPSLLGVINGVITYR